jgi:hypothetical protein
MQQMPAASADPMDTDEGFQKFYAANIYAAPGGHAGDHAFKVWLYSIYKGQSGAAPSPSSTTPIASAPVTTPEQSTTPETTPTSKSPWISLISPDNAFANHDVDLTVTGTDFDTGAKIVFAGTEAETSALDQNTLKATVSAATIPNPGTFQVSVKNSDGTVSNEITFTAT